MKGFYFSIIIFLLMISCQESRETCSSVQIEVVKSVMKDSTHFIKGYLVDKEIPFLVDPYFREFGFDDFITKNYPKESNIEKKEFVLNEIKLSEYQLKQIKRDVNKYFYEKKCKELSNYSTGKRSKFIIRFSGISEKLMFFDIFHLKKDISEKELRDNYSFRKIEVASYDSYVILLDENQRYNKIINLNGMNNDL